MVWRVLLVLVTIGLLVPGVPAAQPAAAQGATVLAPANFVYAQDRDFYVNGRKFRHVGANMVQLMYLHEDLVIQELNFARNAGIRNVRVFVGNDAWRTASVANRLRWLADRAYERGIRVTAVLTDFFAHRYQAVFGQRAKEEGYRPQGWAAQFAVDLDARETQWTPGVDMGFYGPCGTVCVLSPAWVHWGHGAHYRQFVTQLAASLRDHPGIFAWELVNELRVPADDALRRYLLDFYLGIARAIKQADPNHMVATGAVSAFDTFGRSWSGIDTWSNALHHDPAIDYVTVHEYYDTRSDSGQDWEVHRSNDRWRKPVIMEEFAACPFATCRNGDNHGPARIDAALAEVRAYYNWRYGGAFVDQVDAVMYWGVSAVTSGDWGTEDVLRSPTPRVYGGHAGSFVSLWQTWAAELDRQNNETKRIRSSWNHKCVSAPDRLNPAQGHRLHMWDCLPDGHADQANQRFELTPRGELKLFGLCVDALGGTGLPGEPLALWGCHGGANQQWRFETDGSGRNPLLRGMNGLCVDIANWGGHNGAPLVTWTCNGQENERWYRQ